MNTADTFIKWYTIKDTTTSKKNSFIMIIIIFRN